MPDLSAAEADTLLDLDNSTGQEALRRTLLELAWRGLISLEEKREPGLLGAFGKTTQVSCNSDSGQLGDLAEHTREIYRITQEVCSAGEVPLNALMGTCRAYFGSDLERYRTQWIIPSLLQRGLVEERGRLLFGLLGPMRYRLTAEGLIERQRLEAQLEEARALPGALAQNPAGALATIAGLGLMVLLLDDLWPEIRRYDTGGEFSSADDAALAGSGFTLLSWDAFNDANESLDQGFDSSDSDGFGDGDGGGGGGDGGGGD